MTTREEIEALINQMELHLNHLHVTSRDTDHSLKKCGLWNMLRDEIDSMLDRRDEADIDARLR